MFLNELVFDMTLTSHYTLCHFAVLGRFVFFVLAAQCGTGKIVCLRESASSWQVAAGPQPQHCVAHTLLLPSSVYFSNNIKKEGKDSLIS